MSGPRPMSSNAAASSSANMSGAARRFLRHQSSIVRMWPSASGVVRTGRLTVGGATRPRSRTRASDVQPQPTPTMLTARREGLGVPSQSGRPPRRRPPTPPPCRPAGLWAHLRADVRSGHALSGESCLHSTAARRREQVPDRDDIDVPCFQGPSPSFDTDRPCSADAVSDRHIATTHYPTGRPVTRRCSIRSFPHNCGASSAQNNRCQFWLRYSQTRVVQSTRWQPPNGLN